VNIGVMGGTFDPIHIGHLVVAEEVRTRLDLTEVLFVPAGQPWLRLSGPVLVAEHRVQMVRLALTDKPYFRLSTMEVERAGTSYTVDTLAELQGRLGAGDELFFILGWDNLVQLPQWKESFRIIRMCHLVAVPRPGYSAPDLGKLEADIPGLSRKVVLMDSPEIDVSASEIRSRVARGLSIRCLVPEAVAEYIRQHKLYMA
jgi:nicotinate-nucleotide adenylyltransferase